MKRFRVIAGAGLGAFVAAAIAVSPALGFAGFAGSSRTAPQPATFGFDGGIGSFTPASADPRLAAALAKSGLDVSGFRFTPSESRDNGHHNVTVAVHARSASGEKLVSRDVGSPQEAAVGLTPIAYNLGVAVGWKRFALAGDMTHVDLAGQPGSRQSVDVGVSYTGRRLSGRLNVSSDRPLADSPALIAEAPNSTIDVGGSYSLTRNLDVTAGVRYKSEQRSNRLQQLTDDRRDSQAVYIGTAFRF